MRRHYFKTGTIATTTTTILGIPKNVKVNWLLVAQAAPNFDIHICDATGEGFAPWNEVNYDKTGLVRGYNIQCMADIKIANNHASNIITYHVFGEEYIS